VPDLADTVEGGSLDDLEAKMKDKDKKKDKEDDDDDLLASIDDEDDSQIIDDLEDEREESLIGEGEEEDDVLFAIIDEEEQDERDELGVGTEVALGNTEEGMDGEDSEEVENERESESNTKDIVVELDASEIGRAHV